MVTKVLHQLTLTSYHNPPSSLSYSLLMHVGFVCVCMYGSFYISGVSLFVTQHHSS